MAKDPHRDAREHVDHAVDLFPVLGKVQSLVVHRRVMQVGRVRAHAESDAGPRTSVSSAPRGRPVRHTLSSTSLMALATLGHV